ncbi:MAG: hypothetical protein MJA30_08240, partial [Cytophagales bacterium]|nr:hypothetical protein [Cytophagales bacterium]
KVTAHLTMVVMAFDILKAYDSVCHVHMDQVLDWIGIRDCHFYHLYRVTWDRGKIYVVGAFGLSHPFETGCGIHQGCPASPNLFVVLLSGLEDWVLHYAGAAGVYLGAAYWEHAVTICE